ncbi:hypothetical protein BGZ46_007710 [Entomortierella lignicola]|nr:hypothetical protein BGZ46_007710 [Entomortierella lignicola]
MAKKDKKGDGAVQNREIFQRMNFLYQAAMCMATLTTTQQKSNPNQTNNNNNNNNNTSVSNATKSITDDKENDDHANTTKNGDIENSTMDIVDNKDNEMKDISGTNLESIVEIPSSTTSPQGKLSRRKKRELLRRRKNRIAMEQISDNRLHHNLKNTNRSTDLYQLSGTARFYASTLREVGRKSRPSDQEKYLPKM